MAVGEARLSGRRPTDPTVRWLLAELGYDPLLYRRALMAVGRGIADSWRWDDPRVPLPARR